MKNLSCNGYIPLIVYIILRYEIVRKYKFIMLVIDIVLDMLVFLYPNFFAEIVVISNNHYIRLQLEKERERKRDKFEEKGQR